MFKVFLISVIFSLKCFSFDLPVVKYINLYSYTNHYGDLAYDSSKPYPALNDSHINLFIGLGDKVKDSRFVYGIGVMDNSINKTSFYVLGDYTIFSFNSEYTNVDLGIRAYLASGYKEEDLLGYNIGSDLIMGKEWLPCGGIYSRFKQNGFYIDAMLMPKVVSVSVGLYF